MAKKNRKSNVSVNATVSDVVQTPEVVDVAVEETPVVESVVSPVTSEVTSFVSENFVQTQTVEVAVSDVTEAVESNESTEVVEAVAEKKVGRKPGKKPCDISARSLFALVDAGFDVNEIRKVIDEENEEGLKAMERQAKSKSVSASGKTGRPLSDGVLAVLKMRGISVDQLYEMNESTRKAELAKARALAAALKDGYKLEFLK